MPADPISAPDDLTRWVATQTGELAPSLLLIAGDASPRKYYRVDTSPTLIAVHSPATEKNPEFLHIRHLFDDGGVRVPGLLAADLEQGFLLLEDLGDETLLPALTDASVDLWYPRALDLLSRMAAIDVAACGLEPYNIERLQTEMDLFADWFMPGLLGYPLDSAARDLFDGLSQRLIASALEQPQVVVHRDFHSRNLMVLGDDLAVIDFQDAVVGPVTYDPVSLLKDCYIRWPRARQLEWLMAHQKALIDRGLSVRDRDRFVRWFDLIGLQRHIKVLGIFARLKLRDGKPGYLDDLPLVLAYTREALGLYRDSEPALAAFCHWFEDEVMPLCRRQTWFREIAP